MKQNTVERPCMDRDEQTVEPQVEPAEGVRPEEEESYERAQEDMRREPLTEPAEGARDRDPV
jgi:hypothetical protein